MALVDGGTPLRDELTPSALQHKSIAPSLTLTASRNPRARTRKLLEVRTRSLGPSTRTLAAPCGARFLNAESALDLSTWTPRGIGSC